MYASRLNLGPCMVGTGDFSLVDSGRPVPDLFGVELVVILEISRGGWQVEGKMQCRAVSPCTNYPPLPEAFIAWVCAIIASFLTFHLSVKQSF